MNAEFRSENAEDLPAIILIASDETEWRALQMGMSLFSAGKVTISAEYLEAKE
jgi:hypothetical protein